MHFCSLRLRLSLLICLTHSTQIWSGHLFHTLLAMILIRRCLDDDLRQRRRRIREQRRREQQQQQQMIRRAELQRVELQTAEQATIAAEPFAIRVARPPESAAADLKASADDTVLTRQRWYRAVTVFMALCLLFEAGGLLYVRSHYSVDLLLAAVATLLAARSAWIRGLARLLVCPHILQSLETQTDSRSRGASAATRRPKNCNVSEVSKTATAAAPHRHSSAPPTSAPPDTYSSRRRRSRRWCALSCVCARVDDEEEEEERRHGQMAQRPTRPPAAEPQAESAAAAAEPGASAESAAIDISERKQPAPSFARTAATWSARPLRSPLDLWSPATAPPGPHAHPSAPISAPPLDRHTAIDVEEQPHSPPLVAVAAAPPQADQPAELEPETDPAALSASAEQLAARFPAAWIRLRRSRWALRYLSFPTVADFEAKMARVVE